MGRFWDEKIYPAASTLTGDEIFTIYQNEITNTLTIDKLVTEYVQPSIGDIYVSDIGDVDTTGAVDGDILRYDGDDSTWKADKLYLNDLSDVEITNVTSGDRIVYDTTTGAYINRRNFYIGYYASTDGEIETLKTIFQSSQQEIFDDWYRFSHSPVTEKQPARTDEINDWDYDEVDDVISCTINSNTHIGFVSLESYDTYKHDVTLSSVHPDDDAIGVVIAFAVDENGREHTLTAVRTLGGVVGMVPWSVFYNFRRSDNIELATGNGNVKWGNGFTGLTAEDAVGTGTGLRVTVNTTLTNDFGSGVLGSVTLDDDGAGYQLYEQVQVVGGNNNGYLTITGIGAGGVVTSFYTGGGEQGGTGYIAGQTYDTVNAGYRYNCGVGWEQYPSGTVVSIERVGDIITCNTSDLGSSVLIPQAEIVIDLDSAPYLEIFKGPQRYGYSCFSQDSSVFSDTTFSGADLIYDIRNGDAIYYEGGGVWSVHPTRTLYSDYVENTILYTKDLQKAYLRAEDTTVIPFLSP